MSKTDFNSSPNIGNSRLSQLASDEQTSTNASTASFDAKSVQSTNSTDKPVVNERPKAASDKDTTKIGKRKVKHYSQADAEKFNHHVERGEYVLVVQCLNEKPHLILENPACLLLKNETTGMTVLHEACLIGRLQLLEIALNTEEARKALMIKDNYGCLPLHHTAHSRRDGMSKLIMKTAPESSVVKDGANMTPFDYLFQSPLYLEGILQLIQDVVKTEGFAKTLSHFDSLTQYHIQDEETETIIQKARENHKIPFKAVPFNQTAVDAERQRLRHQHNNDLEALSLEAPPAKKTTPITIN